MALDDGAFDYLAPTGSQVSDMAVLRRAAREYGRALDKILPDSADKMFCLRTLRTVAMWANVCVTRNDDGSHREDNVREVG